MFRVHSIALRRRHRASSARGQGSTAGVAPWPINSGVPPAAWCSISPRPSTAMPAINALAFHSAARLRQRNSRGPPGRGRLGLLRRAARSSGPRRPGPRRRQPLEAHPLARGGPSARPALQSMARMRSRWPSATATLASLSQPQSVAKCNTALTSDAEPAAVLKALPAMTSSVVAAFRQVEHDTAGRAHQLVMKRLAMRANRPRKRANLPDHLASNEISLKLFHREPP